MYPRFNDPGFPAHCEELQKAYSEFSRIGTFAVIASVENRATLGYGSPTFQIGLGVVCQKSHVFACSPQGRPVCWPLRPLFVFDDIPKRELSKSLASQLRKNWQAPEVINACREVVCSLLTNKSALEPSISPRGYLLLSLTLTIGKREIYCGLRDIPLRAVHRAIKLLERTRKFSDTATPRPVVVYPAGH